MIRYSYLFIYVMPPKSNLVNAPLTKSINIKPLSRNIPSSNNPSLHLDYWQTQEALESNKPHTHTVNNDRGKYGLC